MLQTILPREPVRTKRGTILVADDDPLVLETVSVILKNAGWAVECAKNGRQALELIYTHHFDGLILDMRMPEYDGYEVCLDLLRRGNKIPTLVITGCIADSEPLDYLNVTKTLRKPVRSKDLLDFVESIKPPLYAMSA